MTEDAPGREAPEATALQRALAWVEHGPSSAWDAPSRLGPIGKFSRRLLRRVLRPYESRRHELDAAVVQALADLNHQLHLRDLERAAFLEEQRLRDLANEREVEDLWTALRSRHDELSAAIEELGSRPGAEAEDRNPE